MRGQPTSYWKWAVLSYHESTEKCPPCEHSHGQTDIGAPLSGRTLNPEVQTSLEGSRVMGGPAQEAMSLGTNRRVPASLQGGEVAAEREAHQRGRQGTKN